MSFASNDLTLMRCVLMCVCMRVIFEDLIGFTELTEERERKKKSGWK
jgi:hypothetical protein